KRCRAKFARSGARTGGAGDKGASDHGAVFRRYRRGGFPDHVATGPAVGRPEPGFAGNSAGFREAAPRALGRYSDCWPGGLALHEPDQSVARLDSAWQFGLPYRRIAGARALRCPDGLYDVEQIAGPRVAQAEIRAGNVGGRPRLAEAAHSIEPHV